MKRGMSALGLLAAGLYLVLAVATTVCPLDHAASHGVRHHHAPGVLQTILCAWACQANCTESLAASAPSVQVVLLALWGPLALFALLPNARRFCRRARAPPQQPPQRAIRQAR